MTQAGTNSDPLARFQGPLRLYPSRWRNMAGIAAGVFFLVLSLSYQHSGAFWVGVLLSGFAIATSLVSMSPQANSLTLHAEGFVVRFNFQQMNVAWRDARDFAAMNYGGIERVMFRNDSLPGPGTDELGGRNAALSRSYGMSPPQLAELMSQWRERALPSSASEAAMPEPSPLS